MLTKLAGRGGGPGGADCSSFQKDRLTVHVEKPVKARDHHKESSTIRRNTAHVSWTINSVTRSILLVAMMCFKKRKCAAPSRTGAHERLLQFVLMRDDKHGIARIKSKLREMDSA